MSAKMQLSTEPAKTAKNRQNPLSTGIAEARKSGKYRQEKP
jgi:hypothetical protein